MKKRMSVSEARATLYELVDYVTESPEAQVVIEHRNRKGRAILVDEARYRYLETTLSELQKREEKPFKLQGSMTLTVPEEEFDAWLEQNRAEQARLAYEKLRDLREP